MPTTPSSKYRPEIDGLRAFAVVAVIINHFNKDLLPSGYLGVDIFFVISGYVITSSLAGRESKNFLDFLSGFYARRVKRLVPALAVFVLITSVLICLFNPEPGVALKTGIASLFGLSNLYLLKQSTDYFAQSTELNPFVHTWSLGVEEQFYLLFPFLIWFSGFGQQAAKGARNLFFWVGALTIASLIGFIYLYQVNQPAAYFLMPTRFWEMAAGCLLFIAFQKRAKIEQALEQVPPLLVVAAMVGVMYLPVAAAVPATIGIVVLSAVLIAGLKRGTVAYKFCTLEKVVYIGLISYSLYLWHWTVLSISRWTIGIHWWSVPIQVGLMVLLTMCSYRFTECPIRQIKFSVKNVIIAGMFLIALSAVTIGTALLRYGLASAVYLGDKSHQLIGTSLNIKPNTLKECGIDAKIYQATTSSIVTYCSKWDSKNPTLWFVGDSHSAMLSPMAYQLSLLLKTRSIMISENGTTFPSTSYKVDKKYGETIGIMAKRAQTMDFAEKLINEKANKFDWVIISIRYPYYFLKPLVPGNDNGSSDQSYYLRNGIKISQEEFLSDWISSLARFAKNISEKKVTILLETPKPEFPEIYLRNNKTGNYCLDEWFNYPRCPVSKTKKMLKGEKRWWNEKYVNILNAQAALKNQNHNILILDAFSLLCGVTYCNYWNRDYLYSDSNHLTWYSVLDLYLPRFLGVYKDN
jgi:peptidoglycan/LPS O-acetylase OafA/YrhL